MSPNPVGEPPSEAPLTLPQIDHYGEPVEERDRAIGAR